ncbi:MAG: SRPBCC domain-containing protein [Saprospiraceae bacterium]|nr:SRPBCC domain-containing protein [Saprospiraceae bacterium]
MSFTIYHMLVIRADTKKVFDAISQPDQLVQWWPLKCSGIPKTGEAYNFNFTDMYDWFGRVEICTPNESFFISMTKSDSDWQNTIFGFELEKTDDGVKVTFSHSGWAECDDHFKSTSFCWAILLNGLKNYVEKGIVIPFEERN